MQNFSNKKSLEALENLLKDPLWKVREQAARSLQKLKPEGMEILQKQNPSLNKDAYDVACYILAFP